ncbi:MAG TPA: hypothetical protein VHE34_21800 [Puia sp.]|uniref:hypothetical protein n=1 Tax=Puia sp. TaxID=2045100 RepID=UPI002C83BB01|nr:hypothetical protein [Puia sp.]HVU97880.1 hypothetical protein [Puia sp.]
MIIYGSRAKQLAKETIADPCPDCQSNNSVDMYVFQRYAHIFRIPFFPITKTGASQCTHCKQVLKLKEMPPSLQVAFDNVKSRTKTPIWTFIGVALIGLLIVNGTISSGRHDAQVSQRLKAPQAGDILEVKKSPSVFTLYKIAEVRPDSVAVLPLLYTVDNPSGLSKLESGSYGYAAEPTMYSRENLSVLLHAGEILDVIRK